MITVKASQLNGRDLVMDTEGLPLEVSRAIKPLLTRVRSILPSWLARLDIEYDNPDDANERNAFVQICGEYRSVTLTICGPWLSLDDSERLRVLCHEIAHLWMNRITDVTAGVVDKLVTDEPIRKLVDAQVERAEEADVDDLGSFFFMLLENRILA